VEDALVICTLTTKPPTVCKLELFLVVSKLVSNQTNVIPGAQPSCSRMLVILVLYTVLVFQVMVETPIKDFHTPMEMEQDGTAPVVKAPIMENP